LSLLLWLSAAAWSSPCEALLQPRTPGVPNAPTPALVPADTLCLQVDLDAAGRASLTTPAVGVSRELLLSRGQGELELRAPVASARLNLDTVRSGGAAGYVGVAGESLVPRVQVAEARLDLAPLGLAAAGGLVDDLWVIGAQDAWALPAVALTMGQEQGWMERSDLGLWAAWTAPKRLATISASALSGEGLARRERNNGQNLMGIVTVRPLGLTALPADRVELSVMARDGSRGVSYTPDHRVGARVTVNHPVAITSAELLLGWGYDTDRKALPAGLSLSARCGATCPVIAWARVDWTTNQRDLDESNAMTWRVGLGPKLPGPTVAGLPGVQLVVGAEGRYAQPQATALAGAEAAAQTHTVFLQLNARLRGGLPLSAT
jgi:hypothetical protein